MFKKLLFLLVIIYVRDSSGVFDAVYDTGKQVWKLYTMLDNVESKNAAWKMGERVSDNIMINQEIRDQLSLINKQLDATKNSVDIHIIENITKLCFYEILLVKGLDTFKLFITSIDDDYEKFFQLMTETSYVNEHRFEDSSKVIVRNVEGRILMIRRIMTDAEDLLPHNENLIYAITACVTARNKEMCNSPQPIAAVLIQLFTMVIIAEIKVNVILGFVNKYQYTANEGWKNMNSITRQQFEKYFGTYVNIFQMNWELIEALPMRSCDPDEGAWIRNKNYYEFEGTLQSTIFQYHWARCMFAKCHTIWHNQPNHCASRNHDERSGCSGTIAECIPSGTIRACVLKSGPHKFEFVNSTKLGSLGRHSDCPSENGYMIDVGDSIHSTCVCTCYKSHNKISLLIMESRVELNMVITGLRFIRKNNILYIQPREGKLMANGRVIHSGQRWIPIPNRIDASQIASIHKNNRVFFLDNVRLSPDFVLTGIKFIKVTRGNVTGFAITIFGTPFNYTSGQLNTEKEMGIFVQALSVSPRRPLLFDQISTINRTLPYLPSPNDLEYVQLKRSLLIDDFGQSTLPLLDAVPIATNPPSVLGGVGIFHKVVEGHAGFISLRVFSIMYGKYVSDFKKSHIVDGRVSFNHSRLN